MCSSWTLQPPENLTEIGAVGGGVRKVIDQKNTTIRQRSEIKGLRIGMRDAIFIIQETTHNPTQGNGKEDNKVKTQIDTT